MSVYFRPLVQCGPARPEEAVPLAGGWAWFTHAERLTRDGPTEMVAATDLPAHWHARLTKARAPIAGLEMTAPKLMGILNVTPDSFSDGGDFEGVAPACHHAARMVREGADIIDIGGESTRPGAQLVPAETEIDRTKPVIAAMRAEGLGVPLSIDTRKAAVAEAAGADLINDVSGFTYDPALATVAACAETPVCVMHAQGTPDTMQDGPTYDNVLLDVFDWLAARIAALEGAGIPRHRILADPGIGFGKTFAHNVALLNGISLFHGLGTALLLGVSRKGFIGQIGQEPVAERRAPGSIAVALHAAQQGVQVFRVHDVGAHAQALALWQACVA